MQSRPHKLLRDKFLTIRLNKFEFHRLYQISFDKKIRPTVLVRELISDLIKSEANQSAN